MIHKNRTIKIMKGLLLLLFVVACSPAANEGIDQMATPDTEPTISPIDGKWAFGELSVEGTIIRLQDGNISFMVIEGETVYGSSGCNNFTGTATFDQSAVSFGPLATTRMACPEDVMAFEMALLNFFEDATTVSVGRDTLEFGNVNGTMKAIFTKVREQVLFVAAEQADCVGVGPQKCLLAKENPEDDYSFFYDKIAGFEWEEGYEYELLIEVRQVINPPADASSLRFELVEVVSKIAVSTEK